MLRRRLATGAMVKAVDATATLDDVISELEQLDVLPIVYVSERVDAAAPPVLLLITAVPWLQGRLHPDEAYNVCIPRTAS